MKLTLKAIFPYSCFLVGVLAGWGYYMWSTGSFVLYREHWAAPLTMVLGSFVAGASSEGGGAVAFPVFTLLLGIEPATARNFSFAIQSIGMTAASLLIFSLKIPVEKTVIRYTVPGGLLGIAFGTWLLVPLISPTLVKLFFVSLWLSFGFALYLTNLNPGRPVFNSLRQNLPSDRLLLLATGFAGGCITAIFGNGIDMLTFCLIVLFYQISEKVATPTSVVVMTFNTIFGFLLHLFVIKDFQLQAFHDWLCSIPVVVFFAPLGAYVISKLNRLVIATLLYCIIVVQFIGALWVIRPNMHQGLFSVAVCLSGIVLFSLLKRKKARETKEKTC
jgi:uncharacterized membrane protein YfcA